MYPHELQIFSKERLFYYFNCTGKAKEMIGTNSRDTEKASSFKQNKRCLYTNGTPVHFRSINLENQRWPLSENQGLLVDERLCMYHASGTLSIYYCQIRGGGDQQ